jgi:cytoplasmic iron level regulating protein YaaA (DUF328/UPF0246 family)
VLILLPPSEGKTVPLDGPAVDLAALSFPELTPQRDRVMTALVALCCRHPQRAAKALGLGPTQHGEVEHDAHLREAPTAPAIDVYSGVLFDALSYSTLSKGAAVRADQQVLIASALWGLVRPRDAIPAYRLSASTTLPKVGTMRKAWRAPVSDLLARVDGLVIDLRSGAYQQLAPPPTLAPNWVSVRVLQERNGKRVTVSHFNKATKGRIARAMLKGRREPTSLAALTATLSSYGFATERSDDRASTIDVIVKDL